MVEKGRIASQGWGLPPAWPQYSSPHLTFPGAEMKAQRTNDSLVPSIEHLTSTGDRPCILGLWALCQHDQEERRGQEGIPVPLPLIGALPSRALRDTWC